VDEKWIFSRKMKKEEGERLTLLVSAALPTASSLSSLLLLRVERDGVASMGVGGR
jgi:hypothetical protein